MDKILIPYDRALKEKLINEADLLLYRGKGLVAHVIQVFTESYHSHVALASWNNGFIENVEFREFKGGRTVNLQTQIDLYPGQIDVYRVVPTIKVLKFKVDENTPKTINNKKELLEFITEKDKVSFEEIEYTFNSKQVTNCLRSLTGLPYGWWRIWEIAKIKLPFIRWFFKIDVNDEQSQEDIYPVCSSVVAHCFRKHYTDLILERPDNKTSPADLSRSPLTHYMFTLTP